MIGAHRPTMTYLPRSTLSWASAAPLARATWTLLLAGSRASFRACFHRRHQERPRGGEVLNLAQKDVAHQLAKYVIIEFIYVFIYSLLMITLE